MADGMVGDKVLTDYKAQPKRDCAKDRNKILDGRRHWQFALCANLTV